MVIQGTIDSVSTVMGWSGVLDGTVTISFKIEGHEVEELLRMQQKDIVIVRIENRSDADTRDEHV